MVDVVLVTMPFGPLFLPSIGLSLLKASLTAQGISSRIFYFTIDYAERVGRRFYTGIADCVQPPMTRLAGEWIFGGELFDTTPEMDEAYVRDVLLQRGSGIRRARPVSRRLAARIVEERRAAGAFLDFCRDAVLAEQPRVVGFTSIFQQHAASLALARRIKSASPETLTVLGGANCEGVMGAETVRQFPFVDAVVSGEGEVVFPELVRRAMNGQPLDSLPGVRTRAGIKRELAQRRFDNTPPILQLDALPIPDYGDYLERFQASRFDRHWKPRLLFETSRGCWWGERMHCTFCGLNGATMRYRSKSPERALSELQSLAQRHPDHNFDVTDNILDLGYFKTFIPELARLRLDVNLFYETKANLRKEQVRLLGQAGIRKITPGIESLSDAVLASMRKGVTGLQNIQLLKWCKELGVHALWGFLCGFPGEAPAEYERMARLIPLLSHLDPPDGVSTIRLDRFSPNFFDAERLGFTEVAPVDAYAHVYPLDAEALHNLAYYFRHQYREPQDVDRYVRPLARAVETWKRTHAESALVAVDDGEQLTVRDHRPIARQTVTVLSGLERRVHLACDAFASVRQLAERLDAREGEVNATADALCARGLMLREDDRLLTLAIPAAVA